jgi:cytochrome c2
MSNIRTRSDEGRSSFPIQAGLAAAALLLAGLSAATRAAGQATSEGDPFRGREIFEEKGCSRCHSVWGHGGALGPEITVVVAGKRWDELVGDFWNHTPQMIDEGEQRGYPWPTLDADEMADVLSYLYYLRLFGDVGDATRGGDAYVRLQCAGCHTLGRRSGTVGGPLDRFGAYLSPVPLAQAMWNAGPRMRQEQVRRGSPIPQFTGPEMADLQAHIRAAGLRPGREISLQPLPNPTRGAEVYRSKRCGTCHDTARTRAPDITRSALSKTASEITGLLWNHSYAMEGEMAARGVPFPRFANNELSDLVAYLYFLGYVGEEGDPARGAAVFNQKGCAACHQAGSTSAPDLAEVLQRTDRAGLASAMWNHAPQMHRIMAERASFWPKFEPGEMRDLASYLRHLARPPGPRS